MDANRRRRSRVALHFSANFTRPGHAPVALITSNISMKGLLAEAEQKVPARAKGMVTISLASDARIEIECRVIRSDATGVAIDFLPMDEGSFFHLRNLVRYNAPDADQIDDEFKTPAFE